MTYDYILLRTFVFCNKRNYGMKIAIKDKCAGLKGMFVYQWETHCEI